MHDSAAADRQLPVEEQAARRSPPLAGRPAEDVGRRARRPARLLPASSARRAAAASADRMTRCSSICPGAARIVVSIGGVARSHVRVDRLRDLFDVRLAAAGDEQRSLDTTAPARRARQTGPRRAPPSSASTRAAVRAGERRAGRRRSTICPGAVPFGFSSTTPPSSTSAPAVRLTSGIFRPRRAKRCTRRSVMRDARRGGTPSTSANASRRHVVVGRSEAAGQDHEVDAIERASKMLGDFAAAVADDGLRPQLDAERGQASRRGRANWCRAASSRAARYRSR